jgi:NADH-quinone oxidoreductase subunit J
MNEVYYISATIALISTLMVITRLNAIHALLYFIVSLFSVAVIFFILGAPFVAALEVIIYAGAIMVLFVFVIMMLNLGPEAIEQEKELFRPETLIGPGVLSFVLFVEFLYVMRNNGSHLSGVAVIGPKQVGIVLFGPYLLGVELASLLLLVGLVGAYHLGRRRRNSGPQEGGKQ